jgi:hypothetical protein
MAFRAAPKFFALLSRRRWDQEASVNAALLFEAAGADLGDVPAPAPPPTAAATAPAPVSEGWYGPPAVVADGLSISVYLSGRTCGAPRTAGKSPASRRAPSLGGVLGSELGAPMVHLVNRHTGRAIASLGLRRLATLLTVSSWSTT